MVSKNSLLNTDLQPLGITSFYMRSINYVDTIPCHRLKVSCFQLYGKRRPPTGGFCQGVYRLRGIIFMMVHIHFSPLQLINSYNLG